MGVTMNESDIDYNTIQCYKFAFKKPGKGKIKIVKVYAMDEKQALLMINKPRNGYMRYGFLGIEK